MTLSDRKVQFGYLLWSLTTIAQPDYIVLELIQLCATPKLIPQQANMYDTENQLEHTFLPLALFAPNNKK